MSRMPVDQVPCPTSPLSTPTPTQPLVFLCALVPTLNVVSPCNDDPPRIRVVSAPQENIYYLCAPNREFALSSPYFESFDKDGIEVLFLYSHIDDFVMKNLERSTTTIHHPPPLHTMSPCPSPASR